MKLNYSLIALSFSVVFSVESYAHTDQAHDDSEASNPLPYRMVVAPVTVPEAGQKIDYQVLLHHENGDPLLNEEMDGSSDARSRVWVTDKGLTEFHFLTPQPTDIPGYHTFSFLPQAAGEYTMTCDVIPKDKEQSVFFETSTWVLGDSNPISLQADFDDVIEGLKFELLEPTYQVNDIPSLNIRVSRTDSGEGFGFLEPRHGHFAHLYAIHEEKDVLMHLHSADEEQTEGEEVAGGPEVEIEAAFPKPGFYALFVDFQINGKLTTPRFVIEVQD